MKDKSWKSIENLLSTYKIKRNFKKTDEPTGKYAQNRAENLIFVIQEHWASNHHFDLRLEMDNVLKSWAVPKKIPTQTGEKYLAIQTEDHPIEYANFAGQIPEGEYGAGTVEITDKGMYDLIDQQRDKISFCLKGEKIKGCYALIKFKDQKNSWLLIKEKE